MSIVVHGLDELAAGLNAEFARLQGAEVKRALRVAVYAGAAKARDLVRARTPVQADGMLHRKPGTLRRAVVAGSERASGEVMARAGVTVRRSGFYWRFLELGTVHMAAHPFIRPAFDAGQDAIGQAIADRLSTAIDDALIKR